MAFSRLSSSFGVESRSATLSLTLHSVRGCFPPQPPPGSPSQGVLWAEISTKERHSWMRVQDTPTVPISAAAPVSQWTGQTALFYIPVSAVKALKIRLFIQLGSLPKIRLGSLVILKPGSLSEESKTPTWKDIKLSKTAPKYPSPLPAICISTSLVGGRQEPPSDPLNSSHSLGAHRSVPNSPEIPQRSHSSKLSSPASPALPRKSADSLSSSPIRASLDDPTFRGPSGSGGASPSRSSVASADHRFRKEFHIPAEAECRGMWRVKLFRRPIRWVGRLAVFGSHVAYLGDSKSAPKFYMPLTSITDISMQKSPLKAHARLRLHQADGTYQKLLAIKHIPSVLHEELRAIWLQDSDPVARSSVFELQHSSEPSGETEDDFTDESMNSQDDDDDDDDDDDSDSELGRQGNASHGLGVAPPPPQATLSSAPRSSSPSPNPRHSMNQNQNQNPFLQPHSSLSHSHSTSHSSSTSSAKTSANASTASNLARPPTGIIPSLEAAYVTLRRASPVFELECPHCGVRGVFDRIFSDQAMEWYGSLLAETFGWSGLQVSQWVGDDAERTRQLCFKTPHSSKAWDGESALKDATVTISQTCQMTSSGMILDQLHELSDGKNFDKIKYLSRVCLSGYTDRPGECRINVRVASYFGPSIRRHKKKKFERAFDFMITRAAQTLFVTSHRLQADFLSSNLGPSPSPPRSQTAPPPPSSGGGQEKGPDPNSTVSSSVSSVATSTLSSSTSPQAPDLAKFVHLSLLVQFVLVLYLLVRIHFIRADLDGVMAETDSMLSLLNDVGKHLLPTNA